MRGNHPTNEHERAREQSNCRERYRLIYITHNKVTMEMAEQLMGVTMHEAGVSRMVTVDVDEAVALSAV